jgi:hypothetical protein
VAHVEFALAAAAIPLGLSATKVWSGEIGERRKTERHRETQLKSCAYHCLRRIWLAARRPMILESGISTAWGSLLSVLSNDGGCVIARSNQAEALGIETGTVTSRRTRFDIAGGVVLSETIR